MTCRMRKRDRTATWATVGHPGTAPPQDGDSGDDLPGGLEDQRGDPPLHAAVVAPMRAGPSLPSGSGAPHGEAVRNPCRQPRTRQSRRRLERARDYFV